MLYLQRPCCVLFCFPKHTSIYIYQFKFIKFTFPKHPNTTNFEKLRLTFDFTFLCIMWCDQYSWKSIHAESRTHFLGPPSTWCGESYQIDLAADGKTKLDRSKWFIPELNPAYYARRCYAGEKCVVGYYKDQKFPERRSTDMKERAGRCVPCQDGKYSDGKVVNPPKCSVCPAGQFAHKKYAKSCEISPKGKQMFCVCGLRSAFFLESAARTVLVT